METVSRRNLLAASGSAALAGALLGNGIVAAQTTGGPGGLGRQLKGPGWWVFRVELVVDVRGADSVRQATGNAAPSGPFYSTGRFYKEGSVNRDGTLTSSANQLGNYRAWGWTYSTVSGDFLGSHEFDFFGLGKLIASGTTELSIPVTGGTANFAQAKGEARAALTNQAAGVYTIEFEIMGDTPGR